jgi:hypothetical protein
MMRGTLTEDPGDLQIGDEIITNAGAQMRCFVVEEVPRVSKKIHGVTVKHDMLL